ncbi:MAG: PAS domain-containing protein, partial [Candidatus Glassbacteria bacterium]|nr:PAS domain-containing protein [Candidatus Glassbacteria bacterium]
MRKRRLLWQLYPSYLFITLLSLVALAWYASWSMQEFYREQTAADLEVRARFLEKLVLQRLSAADTSRLNSLCKEYGNKSETRITVILPSGGVIGDSDEEPGRMDNHVDRPEVIEALAGRVGTSSRYSHTLQKEMMYLAVPLRAGGQVVGVLRTSMPLTFIERALGNVYEKIALGGLVVVLLAAGVILWMSRRISRPLVELKQGAERFSRGDLEDKLRVPETLEVAALAEAMNRMAGRLDDRIRTVERQRNELEALLGAMIEGVMAVDVDERIINMNRAAGKLLKVFPSEARGRSIQEVVRISGLQRFVQTALAGREPVESEIILHDREDRFLQVHGSMLRDLDGRLVGTLIVLNDVTRIHQLENIRREFVSNVSHELKTPITSIKGFVETLLDGKPKAPEDVQRFLEIISRQADRLNAIIEDILSLSRIEQEAEKAEIPLERGRIREVLAAAIHSCKVKAEAKKITIALECPEDLSAGINAALLEQAVVNYIDNAIKYSEQAGAIQVQASGGDGEVVISVRDHGCGIETVHLPRLFERFYRVDKARSRKLGGTGLGLS